MSNLKKFLDAAFSKGESFRDELASEILNSKVVRELLSSDLFAKAVTTVMQKKDEVTKVIVQNVKGIMRLMDVPSKRDIRALEGKVDHLEKVVDRVGKRAITAKSLRTLSKRKKK